MLISSPRSGARQSRCCMPTPLAASKTARLLQASPAPAATPPRRQSHDARLLRGRPHRCEAGRTLSRQGTPRRRAHRVLRRSGRPCSHTRRGSTPPCTRGRVRCSLLLLAAGAGAQILVLGFQPHIFIVQVVNLGCGHGSLS